MYAPLPKNCRTEEINAVPPITLPVIDTGLLVVKSPTLVPAMVTLPVTVCEPVVVELALNCTPAAFELVAFKVVNGMVPPTVEPKIMVALPLVRIKLFAPSC